MKNFEDTYIELGFTLIELLVAVVIVGILVSVAIPEFNNYRAKAYDAAAASDVNNLTTALEAYYVDNQAYSACGTTSECESRLPGYVASDSVGAQVSLFSTLGPYGAGTCSYKGATTRVVGGSERVTEFYRSGGKFFRFDDGTSSLINLNQRFVCELVANM